LPKLFIAKARLPNIPLLISEELYVSKLFQYYLQFDFVKNNTWQIVRKNEYRNLYDYNSKGFCFKYGYDFSVGITRDKRTRLFIGQQFGVLSYKETGDIDLNTLIWGNLNYQESFSQKHSPSHAYIVSAFN
jgi:hypothetical protein